MPIPESLLAEFPDATEGVDPRTGQRVIHLNCAISRFPADPEGLTAEDIVSAAFKEEAKRVCVDDGGGIDIFLTDD